jgi:hypothetical protein
MQKLQQHITIGNSLVWIWVDDPCGKPHCQQGWDEKVAS